MDYDDQGSLMERLGASMEKWLEIGFTSWGTCKLKIVFTRHDEGGEGIQTLSSSSSPP